MNIVFVDQGPLNYNSDTVRTTPLGGTESALIYTVTELAKTHNIFVLNKSTIKTTFGNVEYLPYDDFAFNETWWKGINPTVVINLTTTYRIPIWKKFAKSAKFLVWSHLGTQQPASAMLKDPNEIKEIDGIIAVSDWHKQDFINNYQTDPNLITVIRNGLGKPFENLFESPQDLLARKQLKACYTSAPFRGMYILSHAIPYFKNEIKFDLFSSMKLYQSKDSIEDERLFLFSKAFKGVTDHGVIPQPQLAKQISESLLWLYPCIIEETFCLSCLEAMAAGCRVVATDIGALKSTARENGVFLPLGNASEQFLHDFVNETKKEINRFKSDPIAWSEQQYAQVQYINQNELWGNRVPDWEDLFKKLQG
jgi:glycosyltransferase involved in cell wall biosynthesis